MCGSFKRPTTIEIIEELIQYSVGKENELYYFRCMALSVEQGNNFPKWGFEIYLISRTGYKKNSGM